MVEVLKQFNSMVLLTIDIVAKQLYRNKCRFRSLVSKLEAIVTRQSSLRRHVEETLKKQTQKETHPLLGDTR